MTKDELLKLAIEAGEYADTHHEKHGSWLDAERHQFANLVAAHEREACAVVCEKEAADWERNAWTDSADVRYECKSDASHGCAEAIRARSQS